MHAQDTHTTKYRMPASRWPANWKPSRKSSWLGPPNCSFSSKATPHSANRNIAASDWPTHHLVEFNRLMWTQRRPQLRAQSGIFKRLRFNCRLRSPFITTKHGTLSKSYWPRVQTSLWTLETCHWHKRCKCVWDPKPQHNSIITYWT